MPHVNPTLGLFETLTRLLGASLNGSRPWLLVELCGTDVCVPEQRLTAPTVTVLCLHQCRVLAGRHPRKRMYV